MQYERRTRVGIRGKPRKNIFLMLESGNVKLSRDLRSILVVVSLFDFHRSVRSSNSGRGAMKVHNDAHYIYVPSVNPMCHHYKVGKWVPV